MKKSITTNDLVSIIHIFMYTKHSTALG